MDQDTHVDPPYEAQYSLVSGAQTIWGSMRRRGGCYDRHQWRWVDWLADCLYLLVGRWRNWESISLIVLPKSSGWSTSLKTTGLSPHWMLLYSPRLLMTRNGRSTELYPAGLIFWSPKIVASKFPSLRFFSTLVPLTETVVVMLVMIDSSWMACNLSGVVVECCWW
jgi:hypothetical protein